jgi:ribose transport system substrate-binding protein
MSPLRFERLPRRRRFSAVALTAAATITALSLTATGATAAVARVRSSTETAKVGKAGAEALLAKYAKTPAFVSPGPAIDVSSLAGKTIWVIVSDDSIPFLQAVTKGEEQAAAKVGIKVHIFDGQGETATAATGVQEAVAAKAGAIDVISVNLPYISQAVKQANAANIPVIGVLNTDAHAPIEPGAAGEVTLDYALQGKLLAAYAIATTKAPVQAAFLNFPTIATFTAMKAGIEAGFSSYCPKGCKLLTVNLTESSFKSDAQTDTPAALERDPSLNWLFPAIDGVAEFVIPSVQTLGKQDSVQVGSINAATANLKFVQTGAGQSVDVGNDNAWLGYAILDGSMRAMLGKHVGVEDVPVKVFDAANLKGANVNNEATFFAGADYVAKYAALWTK